MTGPSQPVSFNYHKRSPHIRITKQKQENYTLTSDEIKRGISLGYKRYYALYMFSLSPLKINDKIYSKTLLTAVLHGRGTGSVISI
jgi:hypothetical protein